MLDRHNRQIDYIRVSLTRECNLNCIYCMDELENESLSDADMMSLDEIERACRILSELGIKRVKLTGGEPLMRKGIAGLVKNLKGFAQSVTLTSNGLSLYESLSDLHDAGLDAVNISLNAISPELYTKLCGRAGLDRVLLAIDRAYDLGISLKINCVVIKDINESEIVSLAGLARDKGIAVRFIELMPFGRAKQYEPVSFEKIYSMLDKAYGPLISYEKNLGNGPAVYYESARLAGKLGFINPVSRGFCMSCNRVRLSCEGVLLPCLYSGEGLSVRDLLRRGEDESAIKAAMVLLIGSKPISRHIIKDDSLPHKRGMFVIGG